MQLQTRRLLLKPVALSDHRALAKICADQDVMRYVLGGTYSPQESRRRLQSWISHHDHYGYGVWSLCLQSSPSTLVGFCGLLVQNIKQQTQTELGYRLDKAYWGQGYATEAAQIIKKNAFDIHQLQELIAIIHPQNHASSRVAEKIGMAYQDNQTMDNTLVHIYRTEKTIHRASAKLALP